MWSVEQVTNGSFGSSLPAKMSSLSQRVAWNCSATIWVTGPDGPVAHPLYCRRMQQKLVEFAEAGFPGLAVAAIRVAPFAAWCAEQGQEPDSPEARAEYAAYLTAHGDHDVMAWPPGRNQQCWCGSGHKYKKCCAAASFIDTEPAP
ncbi:hypothetical protein BVW01_18990 [Mycobacterium tuberculosis]|nr:hypothetical protein BVW01_18990 [Mycobacterium tuberculosis]